MKIHASHSHVSRLPLVAGLSLVVCQSASALTSPTSTGLPARPAPLVNPHQIAAQTVATPAETPAEALLAEIKDTPYSARATLRTKLKSAEARFDEKLPEWEAKKNALPSEKKAEADAAFKQLLTEREILRQKIDGVEYAAAETWNSAKTELYTALQNTINTYNKLKKQFDS